ncbi:lipase [Actinoalloteichus sp. AHMU CJ021]|uniref:SGNH/GDSL hydrolase family protein n=1 Tax=Actinoalloteichus sp. AHMU CJ021 TaxID=2072503 RepID=UPI000CA051FF|nr:lipase [Actinoalloteichus sp. AHMU CJ021]
MRARLLTTLAGAALAVATAVSVAPAAVAQQDLAYVALGDSYVSGTGIGQYDPDSGNCQRSPLAYPELWASENAASLTFAACSGATTDDLLANQIGALDPSTDLVSVSIGGNDAGFASVITTCTIGTSQGCADAVAGAQAFIADELPARLDATYAAISSSAPNAEVVVIGYPHLFSAGTCLVSNERRTLLNETADLLADVTNTHAGAAGFTFADARPAFQGRGYCASGAWINGPMLPLTESYHPNANGHANGYLPVLNGAVSSVAAS